VQEEAAKKAATNEPGERTEVPGKGITVRLEEKEVGLAWKARDKKWLTKLGSQGGRRDDPFRRKECIVFQKRETTTRDKLVRAHRAGSKAGLLV